MSSDILSRPLDVSRFGVIYAGAQKNIGPSGLSVVIVRDDLLGRARSSARPCSTTDVAADNGSMYNTPPTFAWYLSGLVFEWLKDKAVSRPWSESTASRQRQAVCGHRRQRSLQQSDRPSRPLLDERALPPGR